MSLIFLTQHEGILGPIAKVLGWILNVLAEFLNLFGIQNTGLTIVLFTFVAYTLMLPLTLKQSKFQKLQTNMAPELSAIQKKYKGKKDEASMRKQQEETSAVYRKFGTSPTAGCLPMLITLPLMFALYRVIYNMPGYVDIFYDKYAPLANKLVSVNGFSENLADAMKNNKEAFTLTQSLKVAPGDWSTLLTQGDNTSVVNNLVALLSQLKAAGWDALKGLQGIAGNADITSLVDKTHQASLSLNSFLGLSVVENPNIMSPAVLIPVLAAGLQFLQTKLMPQANTDPNAAGASTMKTMNLIMPIMSGVFCVILPIGVGLYWVAGSVYRIIQQLIVNAYMKKVDVDDIIKKNLDKQNKKRARRGEKPISFEEITKQRTSTINNTTLADKTKVNKKKSEPSDYKRSETSHRANSIAANANLLARKNGEKGDK